MILYLALCVFKDLKTYKVPNYFILVGLIAGLIIQIFMYGVRGVITFFAGTFLPIFILYPLFFLRVLGAGDIKLFSVIGSVFGWRMAVQSILLSFLVGAFLALIKLFSKKIFLERMSYFACYVYTVFCHHKLLPYYNQETDGHACTMHFTLAIGLSMILITMCYLFQIKIT